MSRKINISKYKGNTHYSIHVTDSYGTEHFLGYSSLDEAVEKTQWALDNPMEREKIAKAGHELVRSAHTYEHRINDMLNIVGV